MEIEMGQKEAKRLEVLVQIKERAISKEGARRLGLTARQLHRIRKRRFTGFDGKIIGLYARGMTVREIQGCLADMYDTEVTPEFISSVTDEVLAEVAAWQSRPLEPMYPVVFFDALRVNIREDGVVRNQAVYLALGVRPDGSRDILIAVTDGLKGMPEALAAALKPIYKALNTEAAEAELTAAETGPWGQQFPAVAADWFGCAWTGDARIARKVFRLRARGRYNRARMAELCELRRAALQRMACLIAEN